MKWFTADTHYGQRNIVKGVTEWPPDKREECRDFKTIQEMNEAIVKNINAVVGVDDDLYHLGDWSFGGIDNIWNFRRQINCKNIHLCLGNHDDHIRENKIIRIPAEEVYTYEELGLEGFNLNTDGSMDVGVQSLFTEVAERLYITVNKAKWIMDHYPHRSWMYMGSKESVMLHGHCHGTLEEYQVKDKRTGKMVYLRTMDVGMDTHPDFAPYSELVIVMMMGRRGFSKVDHHG